MRSDRGAGSLCRVERASERAVPALQLRCGRLGIGAAPSVAQLASTRAVHGNTSRSPGSFSEVTVVVDHRHRSQHRPRLHIPDTQTAAEVERDDDQGCGSPLQCLRAVILKAKRCHLSTAPINKDRACGPAAAACGRCFDRRARRRNSRPPCAAPWPPHAAAAGPGRPTRRARRGGLLGIGHGPSACQHDPCRHASSRCHALASDCGRWKTGCERQLQGHRPGLADRGHDRRRHKLLGR